MDNKNVYKRVIFCAKSLEQKNDVNAELGDLANKPRRTQYDKTAMSRYWRTRLYNQLTSHVGHLESYAKKYSIHIYIFIIKYFQRTRIYCMYILLEK